MPYLGHVQTIIYQGKRLKLRLDERLSHFGSYPLVAILNTHKEKYEIENEKVIRNWMNKYNYKKVYTDDYISLYKIRTQN